MLFISHSSYWWWKMSLLLIFTSLIVHNHHLMLLYTFLIHISIYLSSYLPLFLHSSTYVMYILLLSIKTDNKQVEWSKRSSSASISSLFIMCYVHILNHKWTSVYKSLCLLFPTAFWLFPKIIYILHKGEKIVSGRCHFHIYILKYQ